jgi:hypothetical protein
VIFLRPTCATGIFASYVIIVAVGTTAAALILIVGIFISNFICSTAVFIIIIQVRNHVHNINVILLVCVFCIFFSLNIQICDVGIVFIISNGIMK